MTRIFMLDNYDSFTYNLVQYLGELGAEVDVSRNDAVAPDEVLNAGYAGIVISPGPGVPSRAGISKSLVQAAAGKVPLLGVCLGHQAIGEVYGAEVVRAERLMHGKTSPIHHDGSGLFMELSDPFEATRYHSLILKRDTVHDPLIITAWTADEEVMALRHRDFDVFGVQFHPESILTKDGKILLQNFLTVCEEVSSRGSRTG